LLSAKKIPAGKSGQIEAKIKTADLSGAVEKSITVATNDRRNASVTLSIKAVVEPEVSVSESFVAFDNVPAGKEASRDVLLTVRAHPVKILSAVSQDPDLAVRLEAVPGSEGKKIKLTVIRKANVKPGNHFGKILVKTDSRLMPELTIYTRGNVPAH